MLPKYRLESAADCVQKSLRQMQIYPTCRACNDVPLPTPLELVEINGRVF
jgi:hypothetical protein